MEVVPGMRGVPLNEKQRALLVERRNQLGLTQKDVASRIGRQAITIHTIEAGKYLPSPTVLEDLCAVLSLDCRLMIEVSLFDGKTRETCVTKAVVGMRGAKKRRGK